MIDYITYGTRTKLEDVCLNSETRFDQTLVLYRCDRKESPLSISIYFTS